MRFVDTHIHISSNEYANYLNDVINEAIMKKVVCIIAVSEDYDSGIKTLEISKKYSIIHPALGLHPWVVIYNKDVIDITIKLIMDNIKSIVAFGEVGIDLKYDGSRSKLKDMMELLKLFADLSIEYNKPLNVHSRYAVKYVLDILEEKEVQKVQLHWFAGSISELRRAIKLGYYISFTPCIIYSKHIQKLAYETPIEYILTETDGPIKYRTFSGLTKPTHVIDVVRKLSEIKNISIDNLADRIIENFKILYDISID